MWLPKAIALILIAGAAVSRAETAAQIGSPQPPELQSFLDGQSESDRRRMLDKQQRTFQLEIDGRYAKALKAYCDTGFGDERCFRPEIAKPYPAVSPISLPAAAGSAPAMNVPPPPTSAQPHAAAAEMRELPTVAQISGFGDELAAILVLRGGKRLRVVGPGPNGPRSMLPSGEAVVSIRPGEVLVSRLGDGRPEALPFQASSTSFGNTD